MNIQFKNRLRFFASLIWLWIGVVAASYASDGKGQVTQLAPSFDPAHCGPPKPHALHQPAGSVFEYHGDYQNSPIAAHLLVKVSNAEETGVFSLQKRFYLPALEGQQGLPEAGYQKPLKSAYGLLPFYGEKRSVIGDYRARKYQLNASNAVLELQLGQTISLQSTEESRFYGKYKAVSSPVILSFVGCEILFLAGQSHPTNKYHLEVTSRAYNRNTNEDKNITTKKTIYYSHLTGWWVREEIGDDFMELFAAHGP